MPELAAVNTAAREPGEKVSTRQLVLEQAVRDRLDPHTHTIVVTVGAACEILAAIFARTASAKEVRFAALPLNSVSASATAVAAFARFNCARSAARCARANMLLALPTVCCDWLAAFVACGFASESAFELRVLRDIFCSY